jgi:hypothetical protein
MVLRPGRGKAIRCDDVQWTCEGNRETIFGTTKDEQDTKLGRAEGVGQGLTRGVTGAIFWDHEIHEIHENSGGRRVWGQELTGGVTGAIFWTTKYTKYTKNGRGRRVGTGAYRGRDGAIF